MAPILFTLDLCGQRIVQYPISWTVWIINGLNNYPVILDIPGGGCHLIMRLGDWHYTSSFQILLPIPSGTPTNYRRSMLWRNYKMKVLMSTIFGNERWSTVPALPILWLLAIILILALVWTYITTVQDLPIGTPMHNIASAFHISRQLFIQFEFNVLTLTGVDFICVVQRLKLVRSLNSRLT